MRYAFSQLNGSLLFQDTTSSTAPTLFWVHIIQQTGEVPSPVEAEAVTFLMCSETAGPLRGAAWWWHARSQQSARHFKARGWSREMDMHSQRQWSRQWAPVTPPLELTPFISCVRAEQSSLKSAHLTTRSWSTPLIYSRIFPFTFRLEMSPDERSGERVLYLLGFRGFVVSKPASFIWGESTGLSRQGAAGRSPVKTVSQGNTKSTQTLNQTFSAEKRLITRR